MSAEWSVDALLFPASHPTQAASETSRDTTQRLSTMSMDDRAAGRSAQHSASGKQHYGVDIMPTIESSPASPVSTAKPDLLGAATLSQEGSAIAAEFGAGSNAETSAASSAEAVPAHDTALHTVSAGAPWQLPWRPRTAPQPPSSSRPGQSQVSKSQSHRTNGSDSAPRSAVSSFLGSAVLPLPKWLTQSGQLIVPKAETRPRRYSAIASADEALERNLRAPSSQSSDAQAATAVVSSSGVSSSQTPDVISQRTASDPEVFHAQALFAQSWVPHERVQVCAEEPALEDASFAHPSQASKGPLQHSREASSSAAEIEPAGALCSTGLNASLADWHQNTAFDATRESSPVPGSAESDAACPSRANAYKSASSEQTSAASSRGPSISQMLQAHAPGGSEAQISHAHAHVPHDADPVLDVLSHAVAVSGHGTSSAAMPSSQHYGSLMHRASSPADADVEVLDMQQLNSFMTIATTAAASPSPALGDGRYEAGSEHQPCCAGMRQWRRRHKQLSRVVIALAGLALLLLVALLCIWLPIATTSKDGSTATSAAVASSNQEPAMLLIRNTGGAAAALQAAESADTASTLHLGSWPVASDPDTIAVVELIALGDSSTEVCANARSHVHKPRVDICAVDVPTCKSFTVATCTRLRLLVLSVATHTEHSPRLTVHHACRGANWRLLQTCCICSPCAMRASQVHRFQTPLPVLCLTPRLQQAQAQNCKGAQMGKSQLYPIFVTSSAAGCSTQMLVECR